MSLFTLLDVQFKEPEKRVFDSSKITQYPTNTYRYPVDVGSVDKAHYVVFYINEQVKTSFSSGTDAANKPTIFKNRSEIQSKLGEPTNFGGAVQKFGNQVVTPLLNSAVSLPGVSSALGLGNDLLNTTLGTDKANKLKEASSSFTDSALKQFDMGLVTGEGFARTIRRTKDTIALYMPDSLAFSHDQQYSEVSMNTGIFGLAGVAGSSISDMMKSGSMQELAGILGKNVSPFAAQAIRSKFGDQGDLLFSAATGTVMNPQLELLYRSPQFRNFTFEFIFYPRSEEEARQVHLIIDKLKFHQAPELKKGSAGFFLVPPSEFDIEFHYNGKINPNLPRMSTCVLTKIDLDYAPNGFAAYEVPLKNSPEVGGTGMPVGIRMVLNFMETEILTKNSPTLSDEIQKYSAQSSSASAPSTLG